MSSKKKILLINSHFGMGGIESALVNMANELCEYYDVELFLYYPEGPMKERLDSRIKIIQPSRAIKALGMSVSEVLASKSVFLILFRIFGAVWSHVFNNRFPIWIATKLQPKLKGYDLAVAYRQENSKSELASGYVRVLDRCVEAEKKAAWIHFDATFFKENNIFNRRYYEKIDKVIGVSKAVSEAFKKMNPSLAEKTDYCYNFFNQDVILENAEKNQKTKFPENKFICFSASRLSKGKGIERTISAISKTMHEHKDIMWYIAGDGPQKESIEEAIKKENLADRIVLLGNLKNPYPYIKNSDLFLLTSYHEAAPMVYMEAKILKVPVFSTRTLSVDELLKDGTEDFVCENTEEAIRDKFREIAENRAAVAQAKKHLEEYSVNNKASLEKIENWI